MRTVLARLAGAFVALVGLSVPTQDHGGHHYVFAYFLGNGEDGMRLAHSRDGVHWEALNRGHPVLRPQVGKDRLIRDPSIARGPDGTFHLVWTTGWNDRGFGVAHSDDLVHWSTPERVGVMDHEPGCRNTWAPEIFFDADTATWLVFWASTIEGRYPETLGHCGGGLNHRMYVTTTKDFASWTKAEVYFDPGVPVIDSFLVRDRDRYVLVTKDETELPEAKKHLFVATADAATGPFESTGEPFSPDWVEGPALLRVGDRWICYYDEYARHHYGAMQTRDFATWEPVEGLTHPPGMRHGTAFEVDAATAAKLLALDPPLLSNPSFEELRWNPGDRPDQPFDWGFHNFSGESETTVVEGGGRDGSRCIRIRSSSGADAGWRTTVLVEPDSRYRLSGWICTEQLETGTGRGAQFDVAGLDGSATTAVTGSSGWTRVGSEFDVGDREEIGIHALFGGWGQSTGTAWFDDVQLERLGPTPEPPRWPATSGNPILPDCVADPSISEFDGTFYLTGTTDDCPREGVGHWHNGPGVVWTSQDLVHWSFEGHLMPETDDRLYWAPSRIIQRGDRFLLFPTIDAKIRVAAADSPRGPFRMIAGTAEQPLLDTIDAEVFVDGDGKGYLFSNHRQAWRLNDELTAVVGEPVTIQTGREGYSEGPIVFARNGTYYYLYTLNGHETYCYAYCTSKVSPLGPYETPKHDLVAVSDPERGIHGPGHGSVFSPAGSDDWYLVYLEYGRGGVTRQICIDRLEFADDGSILPVRLTTEGIAPRVPSIERPTVLPVVAALASSARPRLLIRGRSDPAKLLRTEDYVAANAFDASDFTRWLPAPEDEAPWLVLDLGVSRRVARSELALYRPTLGHAYTIEASQDGSTWTTVVRHAQRRVRSPQTDDLDDLTARYLRLRTTAGHPGAWAWRVYGTP